MGLKVDFDAFSSEVAFETVPSRPHGVGNRRRDHTRQSVTVDWRGPKSLPGIEQVMGIVLCAKSMELLQAICPVDCGRIVQEVGARAVGDPTEFVD